jgi:hypothetical protein
LAGWRSLLRQEFRCARYHSRHCHDPAKKVASRVDCHFVSPSYLYVREQI